MMERRTLGRTGYEATILGFGAMEIRGHRIWGGRPVTDAQAERILGAALDAGINLIDTANDYGRSEEYIGRFIAHRRDDYILATKCGCTVVDAGDHDDTPHVWTRDNLLRNIDESLTRLRTDHVDVLQLHNPPVEQVEQEDLVVVLQEIKAAGKTRFIGCSSTLPHLPRYIAWDVFDVVQIPYSALEREREEAIALAARGHRYDYPQWRGARRAGRRGARGAERWRVWDAAGLDELRADGESRTAFMLRFTVSHPDMDTTIVGTLCPAHLAENVRVAEAGPLPPDVYAEAKRRLDAIGRCPLPAVGGGPSVARRGRVAPARRPVRPLSGWAWVGIIHVEAGAASRQACVCERRERR